MTRHWLIALLATSFLSVFPALGQAQNVKITPLGSHNGELCDRDRATVFEDPTGVRILYDVGHSLTGADDARLGAVHAVLLSHLHGDHIGDQKLKALGAGACEKPETVSAGGNSMTAEVAAAKNAVIAVQVDMAGFIAKKVENITGKPTPICGQSAGAITVPVPAVCRTNVHLGGTTILKAQGAAQGVEITIVYASHANNLPLSLISEPLRTHLGADGMSIISGPPTGYVVKFTNGLTVYLSGDTGIHTEMKSVVHDFHKANLAVFNLGPNAVTTLSALHAINDLVRPSSVILSHVNEAATVGGKLRPGSRTAAFINQLKGRPAHLAISGRTMEFDGSGKCVGGC